MGGEWLTLAVVAELAGCATATVMTAVQRGEIGQRPGPRSQPSLDRDSALAWVRTRQTRSEARDEQRRDFERRRRLAGRPDIEHEWLTHAEAAAVLGISRNRVAQLASADRLPFTVVDERRWFRADHIDA